jgi:hypothetical protein
MRRTKTLRLVLLGGGLVAMAAGCGPQPPRVNDQTQRFACEQAKAQNLPNAMEICRQAQASTGSGSRGFFGMPWIFGRTGYTGSSSGSTGGSWFSGRSASPDRAAAGSSSSSRGGFGSTASSSRSSGS